MVKHQILLYLLEVLDAAGLGVVSRPLAGRGSLGEQFMFATLSDRLLVFSLLLNPALIFASNSPQRERFGDCLDIFIIPVQLGR